MALDTKDWEIFCEILKEFQQKLEAKIEAYTSIYTDEPYPTEIQHNAVWLKDVCICSKTYTGTERLYWHDKERAITCKAYVRVALLRVKRIEQGDFMSIEELANILVHMCDNAEMFADYIT